MMAFDGLLLQFVVFVVSVGAGAQLGTIVSLLLSALLCHFVGWQVVFYAIGNHPSYYRYLYCLALNMHNVT